MNSHTLRIARRATRLLAGVLLVCGASSTVAQELAAPISVDLSGLPALGSTWREDNPYRGDALAAAIGREVYTQACSRCHGVDGDATHSVGTDLRMVDIYCYRTIKDAATRRACVRDNDHYFKESVLKGKLRVGVVHMPAWEKYLSQEAVWSVRTFLESRRP